MESFVNARGNIVYSEPCGKDCFEIGQICKPERGWAKYHTSQDDFHFGIWVNSNHNQIITLSHGEFSIVECETDDTYQLELEALYAIFGEDISYNTLPNGKFDLNAIVSCDGRHGTVRGKTLQTDLGWTYLVHFDDQAEWVDEPNLVRV